MKKSLLLAGIAGVLFTHNAQAENTWNIKPVVGMDYVYSTVDLDDGNETFFEDKMNAFALSAGVKINNYFGIEAFYQQSEKAEKSNHFYAYGNMYSLDTTIKYRVYGADLVGYLPVADKFDLIGTAGVAYYDAKITAEFLSGSEKEVGFRLGAGAQYNVNDNVALRLMGRYNYTGIDGAKNMFDITAGARYYF